MITFRPLNAPAAPTMVVVARGGEFVFELRDSAGEVQVATSHIALSDALLQVSRRMSVEDAHAGARIHYEVSSETSRQMALQDAANYLRERAEKLRQSQRRDYSGERARNINALTMWANQVRKL